MIAALTALLVALSTLQPVSPQARFVAGYEQAQGDPNYLGAALVTVYCESRWILDPGGAHLGLAQFTQDSWEKARRAPDADPYDAFEQGWAVARWISLIYPTHPKSLAGWAYCWPGG